MKTITKEALTTLRPKIDQALKELGQRLGIELKVTKGQFTNGPTGHFTLEIATLGADGQPFNKEADDFTKHAELYDLSPDDLGEVIEIGGKNFTIIGLLPSRPKNCIQIRNHATGQTHITTAPTAKRCLAAARARRNG